MNIPTNPPGRQYCVYCGRIQHRCQCEENARLKAFFERQGVIYRPRLMANHYKRGVPPQLKRRERQLMRTNYKQWYAALSQSYGEACANCGETSDLVIDHVVPVAKGGRSEFSNLQLLCATCNRLKGKLVLDCRPGV